MELSFGSLLKKRRRALDFTQEDLAARTFCSVNTIRKIEADALVPSKALALELARALNIPEQAHAEFVRFARTPGATAPENAFTVSQTETVVPAERHSPEIRFRAPAPLNAVIGREHDIGVISRMLQLPATRLVTLTGPPGTGKTRLALEVAAQAQDEFKHGAAFVSLAPLTTSAQIEFAVANALGVRETDATTLTAALRAFLREKELMLVLDNLEHLLGFSPENAHSAGALVAEWLSRAPHLKILVTSREPLRVHGEREIPVSPLTTPPFNPPASPQELGKYPAVQLFVERAQEVNVSFQLNAANAAAVARVCVELEGLPLAIEMAAARVKWESPQQLLPHLSRRLEALSSGRRDHDARQQTLRGALDWSYALLDESEKRVFRMLGVFRGGFTLEAALAVCELPTPRVLENLVEKSLVKMERSAKEKKRYALLEFIREYAREHLGVGGNDESDATTEMEIAQARHYAFFVQLAERGEAHMNDHLQNVWTERLESDYDNLRAALEWAEMQPDANLLLRLTGALHLFWLYYNPADEVQTWYEKALAKADDDCEPLYLAKAYSGAGSMAWAHSNITQAAALHAQAIRYYEQTDDQNGLAFSTHNLAVQKTISGDHAGAMILHERALRLAREVNNQALEGQVLISLGMMAHMDENVKEAISYYEQARACAVQADAPVLLAVATSNLGCVASYLGDFERAAALLAESSQLGQDIHYHQLVAGNLAEQGLLLIRQGQPAAAIPVCRRGAELSAEFSFHERLAGNTEWLGAAFAYLHEFEHAARLWGAASAYRQEIGMPVALEYRADYERAVAFARTQFGSESFDHFFAQGQQMNPLELVRERNGIHV